jgi:hypothetical protein
MYPIYTADISRLLIDHEKKNVKRREYKDIDNFIEDMELMFENAKAFNEDDSQLYKDAVLLQVNLLNPLDLIIKLLTFRRKKCVRLQKSKRQRRTMNLPVEKNKGRDGVFL